VRKLLLAAVSALPLVAAGSAFAQGLPSNTSLSENGSQPWSINQHPARNENARASNVRDPRTGPTTSFKAADQKAGSSSSEN
jgi:hypothetical protein